MKKLVILWFLLYHTFSYGTTVYDTLYINTASYTLGNFTFNVCVFNDSANFKMENAILEIATGDNVMLHVINNDTLQHTFTIDGFIQTLNVIPPNGSKDFNLNFTNQGAYRFYSDKIYGEHLGASSIIMYGLDNKPKYYWNMFEQSDTLSVEIVNQQVTSIPFDYQPDLFMINMKVHPDLESDSHAKIMQQVGDTIYIVVLNSGKMLHTLHFHGYHVEIVNASINSRYNGWIKDSFGILTGEILMLKLIPNKPGLYPVHEHNLINVTTNGVYPGGMLNLIDIQP